eukprot:3725234-Amphidinium_carterae.1
MHTIAVMAESIVEIPLPANFGVLGLRLKQQVGQSQHQTRCNRYFDPVVLPCLVIPEICVDRHTTFLVCHVCAQMGSTYVQVISSVKCEKLDFWTKQGVRPGAREGM